MTDEKEPDRGPLDVIMAEAVDGKLMTVPIVGRVPEVDDHWLDVSGWAVWLDDNGGPDFDSFHDRTLDDDAEEAAEAKLREQVRALPLDPKFSSHGNAEKLRQSKETTIALLVHFVHEVTQESVWVLYHNLALNLRDATGALRASLEAVESDESDETDEDANQGEFRRHYDN